jgi:two-component system cell cycle response regulator
MMSTPKSNIRVLVVEDNPADFRLIQEMLGTPSPVRFQMDNVARLEEALRRLEVNRYDVTLLELNLPDQQGLATLLKLSARFPEAAVIVLTGMADEDLGLKTVQKGAQDFLVKSCVNGDLLRKSIRFAIERHHSRMELIRGALIDDLTGLYNRRGFFSLAEQQMKLARRGRKEFLLISGDLDGMKWINDTFGHPAGDQALIDTAMILQGIFRQSDIVARIGGDEFVILMIDAAHTEIDTLLGRCAGEFEKHNQLHPDKPYALSLSLGAVAFDPQNPGSVEELLWQADIKLYEMKRGKNNLQAAGSQGKMAYGFSLPQNSSQPRPLLPISGLR